MKLEGVVLGGEELRHLVIDKVETCQLLENVEKRIRREDAAVDIHELVRSLHRPAGIERGHVGIVEVLTNGQAVVGRARPDRGCVHHTRDGFRKEVIGLAIARSPAAAQIRIDEVADIRQRPVDVEAESFVGDDEREDAAGVEDMGQILHPADWIGDVLEHVRRDHIVERRVRRDNFGDGRVLSDHIVNVDDVVEPVLDHRVVCVFASELFGARVVQVSHRALILPHPGSGQRPDLESAHVGNVDGGQLPASHADRV